MADEADQLAAHLSTAAWLLRQEHVEVPALSRLPGINRRTGHVYLPISGRSVLSSGRPDFDKCASPRADCWGCDRANLTSSPASVWCSGGRSLHMVTLFSTRLGAAVGGLTLWLTTGIGFASADPDLDPVINTTCSYSQVVSAINAQNPAVAAGLSASPSSQAALRGFLVSSPEEREQIVQELRGKPGSQQYFQEYAGAVLQVANTCNNY